MAHSTSTDRSSDPSPFAWIFAAALAVVGLGSVLTAWRTKRVAQQEMASATGEIEGHPS
ncbi:MAG: hypothetical protein Q4P07_07585 [Ornithinimicrobium sp.]|uniref:hypothetical protein n=1 Tax=Ornithinimicrobium sp. TaxID=1977084 RepID=UPI0026DF9517|nr:hypothetical protein [Ornithinimicrobium sp.]MDO5739995.1 hypothetical protein [Ornithinimicrobium sp.]